MPPYAAPMQAQAPVAAPPARRWVKPAVGVSRPKGLLLLAIGLGLGAFNVYSLMHDGHYYPKSLLIAPVALLVGLFAVAVGAPVDPQTGHLPLWARIGYGACAIAGLALGIIALVFVGC